MSIAVPSLTCGVQLSSAPRDSIRIACPSNRITTLCQRARRAEPPASIAPRAQPQLRMTSPTNDDPKALRTHAAPTADFWTRSSRCDEGAGLHRTEIQKARELALSGFHYFRRALSILPTAIRPKSAPVNGERRPPPSRDLHRLSADRGARSQGAYPTSALVADDTTIVNATSLLELEDDGCVQVIVCTSCGTVHCESGGWVQPRRFGDTLLWLPCFERLSEDGAEFRPPDFFKTRGLPVFDGATVVQLGDLLPLFRRDVAPSVTYRDVALAVQWLAPWQVLGTPGGVPRLKREIVVATSHDDLEFVVSQVESLIGEALSDTSPVRPARATPGPELYLDGAKSAPVWNPLVFDDSGTLRLSLDGVTAAVRGPG